MILNICYIEDSEGNVVFTHYCNGLHEPVHAIIQDAAGYKKYPVINKKFDNWREFESHVKAEHPTLKAVKHCAGNVNPKWLITVLKGSSSYK